MTALRAERMIDESVFRQAMARFATCVTVTTTSGAAGPVGCTTTAVLSLSLRPPTLLVSLRSTGRTLDDLLASGRFAVNVLAGTQRELVHRFATGDPIRRFEGIRYAAYDGVPVLLGTAAVVVCQVCRAMPVLDHTLLVGTVRRTLTCPRTPLVLLDGQTHRLDATTTLERP
jgi:flavin reductase (DIM6/NTAB) family NADH-FMN oxidoreductase RutF